MKGQIMFDFLVDALTDDGDDSKAITRRVTTDKSFPGSVARDVLATLPTEYTIASVHRYGPFAQIGDPLGVFNRAGKRI